MSVSVCLRARACVHMERRLFHNYCYSSERMQIRKSNLHTRLTGTHNTGARVCKICLWAMQALVPYIASGTESVIG